MANTSFENAIRSYLEDRAKADSLFAYGDCRGESENV